MTASEAAERLGQIVVVHTSLRPEPWAKARLIAVREHPNGVQANFMADMSNGMSHSSTDIESISIPETPAE